jgi:hypothetical protein
VDRNRLVTAFFLAMPDASGSLKTHGIKALDRIKKMTNHIKPYKKWYVLGFVLLLCANLLGRRIWRFTVLSISNAANLTNAGFQGEIRTLIKFFLPDAPCLKADALFY